MISDNKQARLKGLILCGGKSTRMQQDKSQLAYHGQPHWQYLLQLFQEFVPEVYLSCRQEQAAQFREYPHIITDSVDGAGPSAGLLSAHAAQPDVAWLVLACDLPLISRQSLAALLQARNPLKAATSFNSHFNNSPEPLIAIWEPAALAVLQQNFATGKNCPRKTLLGCDVLVLENVNVMEQFNANTPAEMQEALQQLTDAPPPIPPHPQNTPSSR